MLMRDLLACNKDWQDDTDLIVVAKDDVSPVAIRPRVALAMFGSRQVLWFRDCVVMVL